MRDVLQQLGEEYAGRIAVDPESTTELYATRTSRSTSSSRWPPR